MKTKAAVLRELGNDFEITEMDLDPPKTGEVLMRWVAAGLCHSDEHLQTGDIPVRYPIVGGHEGAGIVEEVGAGVTRLKPGDHVVCSFLPVCGNCRFCARGMTNLCDLGALLYDNCLPDGTFRFHAGGLDFGQMCLLGTFSQYWHGVGAFLRQDRRRPAAGDGGAGRLRGSHRLGHGGQRGRRAAG